MSITEQALELARKQVHVSEYTDRRGWRWTLVDLHCGGWLVRRIPCLKSDEVEPAVRRLVSEIAPWIQVGLEARP